VLKKAAANAPKSPDAAVALGVIQSQTFDGRDAATGSVPVARLARCRAIRRLYSVQVVTRMAGDICIAAGHATVVAGNIGTPVLDALTDIEEGRSAPTAFVLELSSFQLETTTSLDADAAAMLARGGTLSVVGYGGTVAIASASIAAASACVRSVPTKSNTRSAPRPPVSSRTASTEPSPSRTSWAPSSAASRRRLESVSTAIRELDPSSRRGCTAMWPTPPTPITTAVVPGTASGASRLTAW
jgi:hypothetical protein